ncbi:hypothetical protein BC829DRAFT_394072 [Chytridium lagenaria]|nr:hypothetical protein BC829DRAFT_394072 [Chytridium lagenaria]
MDSRSSSSTAHWNTTDCLAETICLEPWFNTGLYSYWYLMRSGFLSEGSLSLIITVAAGTALGMFFVGFSNIWNPLYCPKNPREELDWLSVSNGVGEGNVIAAGIQGIILSLFRRLDFIRLVPFSAVTILFPMMAWILVSTVSGLAQMSIHSASRTLKSLNLTAIIEDSPLAYYAGSGTRPLAHPLSKTVGHQVLLGGNQNLSRLAFQIDGLVCGGQLIPESIYTTRCLVDTTVCKSDSYRWPANSKSSYMEFQIQSSQASVLVDNAKTSVLTSIMMTSTESFTYPLINIPNWIIENKLWLPPETATRVLANSLQHDWHTRLEYHLHLSHIIPQRPSLKNLAYWSISADNIITPPPIINQLYPSPARLNIAGMPVDIWQGACHHSIDISNKQRCTRAPFIHERQLPKMFKAASVVGIGRFGGRTQRCLWEFVLTNGTSDIVEDQTISATEWMMERYVMDWEVRIGSVRPVSVIAVDVVLCGVLGVFMALAFGTLIKGQLLEGGRGRAGGGLLERRLKWDPVLRYKKVLEEKNEADVGTAVMMLKENHDNDINDAPLDSLREGQ